ncbi:DUF3619 family protein [Rhodoferax sp.]|uniref:DUF3619 family protein n=1 Tax=Rhodoferax sp. TaxID=50421 RepID=UPI002601B5B8|nr:DUF3619 family protein [Rhodoferax sp.]MDD2809767.1 DUF3619 family protein [Rhodoferax sp.]
MNQTHSSHTLQDLDPALDAAGRQLAHRLLVQIDDMDPHTLQRLRAVREQAVDQRRNVLLQEAQLRHATASHSVQGHSLAFQPYGKWPHQLTMAGMLLALVFGLWMINTIQSDNFVQDAAEIDNVLLTDDLPPAAYLDPGFKHFLKLSFPEQPL